jgi:hypothetical protein
MPTSQLTEPHEAYASQSKSEKCEIAETQLRQRARLQLGQSTGYRPRPDPSQMAFRTCKEAMSAIWCWPVLKRKMAIPSRQRTTTSTPNITTDRCSPKTHDKRRLTKTRSTKANPGRTEGVRKIAIDLESTEHNAPDQLPPFADLSGAV